VAYMKKISFGLFLFFSIISFIFSGSEALAKTDQKSSSLKFKPAEIRKTNVKDTKFTISWRTPEKASGFLMYGETASCGQIAFDDRGKDITGKIHYITIRDLKPSTAYYYKIVSDGKAYQNNNQPFNLSTGSSIMATGSDVAYGRIYKRKKIPYTNGAIVYLTLCDKDGKGSKGVSSPVSVTTDKNGYWSYELKNFREENVNNLFAYSAAGDVLLIEVQVTSLDDTLSLKVDTKADSPVRDIAINKRKRGRCE